MRRRPADHAAQRDIAVEIRQPVRDADGRRHLQRAGHLDRFHGPRRPCPARPARRPAAPRRCRCSRARSRSAASPACRRTAARQVVVSNVRPLSKLRYLAGADDRQAHRPPAPPPWAWANWSAGSCRRSPARTGSARPARIAAASGARPHRHASFMSVSRSSTSTPRPSSAMAASASPNSPARPLGPGAHHVEQRVHRVHPHQHRSLARDIALHSTICSAPWVSSV
jgi:hypothetical protein